MCYNPPLPASPLGPAGLLLEPLNGMERAAGLEGADLLKAFALEPEADDGLGRGAPSPLGTLKLGGRPRGRGEPVKGGIGEYGGFVDVGLDQLVCGLN